MAEFTVKSHSASDGYTWKYRCYVPRGIPRGHLICLHGIQSHAGWYGSSCEWLRQIDYLVTFLDRRGSGMNQEKRGDAPGFRRLLDDVAEFVRTEADALPRGAKKILIGISWGGKLATAFQRRHPGLIDGLVLLCPGFYAKVRPPLGERLKIAWARLVAPRRLFPVPLNDPRLFTATPRWVDFLREDPLLLREATARLLVESARLDGYLRLVPQHVRIPVLVLLAQEDRIIDNERTRRFVDRFGSSDRQVIEYAGAHHTLEFEPEPRVFLSDLQGWLNRHTSTPDESS